MIIPIMVNALFSDYIHNTFPLHTLIFINASVCLLIVSELRFLRS